MLPVIIESVEEGVGDVLSDAGVIVDVDEDREAVELGDGVERCVSFSFLVSFHDMADSGIGWSRQCLVIYSVPGKWEQVGK